MPGKLDKDDGRVATGKGRRLGRVLDPIVGEKGSPLDPAVHFFLQGKGLSGITLEGFTTEARSGVGQAGWGGRITRTVVSGVMRVVSVLKATAISVLCGRNVG